MNESYRWNEYHNSFCREEVWHLILLFVYSVALELVTPTSWLPGLLSQSEQVTPPSPPLHYHPKQTWLPQLQFDLLPSLPLVLSTVLSPCPPSVPILTLSMQCKNSNRSTGAPQERAQKQTTALSPTVNTDWRGLWKAWCRRCVWKSLLFAVVSSLWVAGFIVFL